ncbi:MAG: hypothetical protein EOR73_26840 [Mesorhizobium sp.]|nr:MAG: hypothetical protein EOR73_26840 [Mesorhizobium sp.]
MFLVLTQIVHVDLAVGPIQFSLVSTANVLTGGGISMFWKDEHDTGAPADFLVEAALVHLGLEHLLHPHGSLRADPAGLEAECLWRQRWSITGESTGAIFRAAPSTESVHLGGESR